MKADMEIVKTVVRVGNSAGVILPRDMLNYVVRVEIVREALDLKGDIYGILDDIMDDVQGIYLTGSYARKEEREGSDVDVFVVSGKTKRKIVKGKYNILILPFEEINKILKKNALPLAPMIKEAKALMNQPLLRDFEIKLSNTNLKWYLESVGDALKINEKAIEISELNNDECDDAVAYSLVLNLRSAYIADCLLKGKKWSNAELKRKIKEITGNLNAYEGYLRVKDNKRILREITTQEARKLVDYIQNKVEGHKKWLNQKRA